MQNFPAFTEHETENKNIPLPRADVDIIEDVWHVVRDYPPLQMSREFIQVESHGGHVVFHGNVRSVQCLRRLQNEVPYIVGVQQVSLNDLFDDEAVRLRVAEKLPDGLYVNVQYGVVSLNGKFAAEADQQALVTQFRALPGVRQVIAQFESQVTGAHASEL